jgi:FG-GAP-like repeat
MATSPRLALATALCLLTTACTSWADTRRNIITPLNRLVHADYPNALATRDTERVTELFAPDVRGWAARDTREITGRFQRIDHSRCVIHDSTPPDHTGAVRTHCVLRLDGISLGEKLTWEQERVITARPDDGVWSITKIEPGRTIEVPVLTTFVEEAVTRGLVATNHSRGTPDRTGTMQPYLGSGGVAVADVDGDGDDDLLMISGDKLRLFRNDGGQFHDMTTASGIVTPDKGECRCGYFGDIDNDGDQDLFVAMFLGENLLFQNDGAGRFRRVPNEQSGLATKHGQTSAACFGDFDGDGDLDLVLANGNNMYTVHPDPEYNARNGLPDQYYENNGDGTFVDKTEKAGLGVTGWALACAVSDYDKDGDLDLFIANDIGLDVMYRNRGDGTFEDVTEEVGFTFPGSSMSADFGDLNGDGWSDLYVSGMASNSRWLLRQPGFPVPVPFPLDILLHGYILDTMWSMFHGNRLYLNNQDGTFREVSTETRSYWFGWAWAAVFLDYDNDGALDIYGANGFWTGADPTDC